MTLSIINQPNLILLIKFLTLSLLVLFLIKITRPVFIKRNWLDHSNDRKKHLGSIPLNGGLSMFFGLFVGLILIVNNYTNYKLLIICSAFIFLLGLLDDVKELSHNIRILAQIFICLFAFSYGPIQINTFGDIFGIGVLEFDRLSVIITVLALMAGMNSFNLIDGIDGLASGTAIIAFSSILFLANQANVVEIINISLLYLSVLIPFFCINISNQKVFMGDSGSLFIGLGIAWFLIEYSQGNNVIIKPVTALWIFAIPLFDIISVIICRIKAGLSPFKSDDSHIHFQIIKVMKITSKQTMLLLIFISSVISFTGVFLQLNDVPEWVMFFSLFGLLIFYIWALFSMKKSGV
jgi:UDP-GlcNAc:undecaprenyl-phosphate/decaprenyl-phosphate GlcNAc-1-phosphate transferase